MLFIVGISPENGGSNAFYSGNLSRKWRSSQMRFIVEISSENGWSSALYSGILSRKMEGPSIFL